MFDCCGCLDTPQSILDDEEIDVFEEIIADSEQFYTEKRMILWSYYRYRGIGNQDLQYWIQCMKDRYNLSRDSWNIKFAAWNDLKTKTATARDMADGSTEYEIRNTNEDLPDNATEDTVYLTDRQKTVYSGKSYGGLETETADAYINGVPRVYDAFAREFADLFYFGV